jgi:hypothetical protein
VTATKGRVRDGLVLLAAGVIALGIAGSSGVHRVPTGDVLDSLQAAIRGVLATLLVFGVAGFGVTRLLLPEALRRYELLCVPAVGACVLALAMTVLGFAFVPFHVSLAITLAAGAIAGALALRRAPGRPTGGGLFWPGAIAFLLAAVALVPYFGAGFPTVSGFGSDAFHAVGATEFLQHNHPLERHADGPLDRFPLRWGSKQPIYYALGSVASVAGLEPYETLAPVAAVMITLAAVGIFLLATELLGASLLGAGAAMAVTGLNAMVLRTALNPYFNQTWGYFTLPFTLVLGWWAVHHRSRPAAILLALFLAVGGFAYPLMLPIPLLAIAIFVWLEPVRLPLPRTIYRGPQSLLWIIPLAVALLVPVAAAAEKVWAATVLLADPGHSLRSWGGDIFDFIPAHQFFSLPEDTLWWLAVAAMAALAIWLLVQLPRSLGVGLAAVMVTFLAAGVWFRQREFGQYFEFKTLAFSAPLLLTCAAVALSRFRRVGPVLLALFVISAGFAGRLEVRATGTQLSEEHVELREWATDLPSDASIRLDTFPANQLWSSYMLSSRRLCSRLPLLGTDYPHVVYSRDADFILTDRKGREFYGGDPPDASGPALRRNRDFTLYRAKPGLPGEDLCSKRLPYGRDGLSE